jgi:hypothetical protein
MGCASYGATRSGRGTRQDNGGNDPRARHRPSDAWTPALPASVPGDGSPLPRSRHQRRRPAARQRHPGARHSTSAAPGRLTRSPRRRYQFAPGKSGRARAQQLRRAALDTNRADDASAGHVRAAPVPDRLWGPPQGSCRAGCGSMPGRQVAALHAWRPSRCPPTQGPAEHHPSDDGALGSSWLVTPVEASKSPPWPLCTKPTARHGPTGGAE